MPVIEITLEQLLDSHDWEEVFGEGSGGNTDKTTDICPPGADVNPSPPMRADVEEIIAAVNGDNDGPDWVGVFRLKDGRYCVATGGCDYTGWDCRASNHLQIAATLDNAINFGLTPEEQRRLGY